MNPDAAHQTHKMLVENTDLYSNVIEAAGAYDAKLDPAANSSLAAHILNAVTVGVNTFVFNAVGSDESFGDYDEEIKVLAAALVLHDTNKYLREARGLEIEGNTPEAFDEYFEPESDEAEADPFGIEEFLGEGYREDLLYLVQRTETTENTTSTRNVSSGFAGLARYCRIGDAVSSVALRQGIEGAYRKLSEVLDEDRVHLVRFTELEQPILNDVLLGNVKQVLAGGSGEAFGVVIGSSPSAVLYLGENVSRSELRKLVNRITPEVIRKKYDFSCKLEWNSFDYDILSEVDFPIEQKLEQIQIQAEELLLRGAGGIEEFESIPEEFKEYLPFLVRSIYQENRKEYPTESLTKAYEDVYDSIEGSKNRKAQLIRIEFLSYLCKNYREHIGGLNQLQAETEHDIEQDLRSDTDTIKLVIDRFFGDDALDSLISKSQMCFLCGREASSPYKKGQRAIYRGYGYSRRVPPHEEGKSICNVCNLEYALSSYLCELSDVSISNNVEFAYFQFDDFLADVRVRSRPIGNVVQGDSGEMDDREVTMSLLEPQYYIQPIYVRNENHRMAVVRQVMEAAQESGMKVVIGRPFTRFESTDAVFADEEATRPQELLGLDRAERFGPLPEFADERSDTHLRRALQLFRIMGIVGQEMRNPYLQLNQDTFHSIAHLAVVNYDGATELPDLREYVETYHNDAYQTMREIAEQGVNLFGISPYDSKYKKTKIFRETLDAILAAKSQGMDDARLLEYVSGQVYAATDREQYAPAISPEDAETFVRDVRAYLQEEGLDDLKKLSDWEDALVNTYYTSVEYTLQD